MHYERETMTIGIDNGLEGAAVLLDDNGMVHNWFQFESICVQAKPRKIREIATWGFCVGLDNLLQQSREKDRENATRIVFEQCPHHAASSAAMRGMAINAGKIIGALESRCLSFDRITSRDWQPRILGKVPKGKTKEYARAKFYELWPHLKAVKHDGIIDAALIAYYGHITQ